MRLKSARLHGLIGVYSASGKKEIYIDFTRCRNNIILIIGENGAGKTTIWEALQPIPLPPSKFIDKEPGFVELEYIHQDTLYKIRIEYPITNSRERGQTKAFISRISNNEELELNPNGNIGSYKSALYSEFNLDPNFVSLSQLSSEDMGIVSKKPSERKKFVASILDSIEVYNNIHKTLSKRSTIFKSMINSITAKIDTIGNQEKLLTQLNALTNRIQRLNNEKSKMIQDLALCESTIRLTDPNGEIQNIYKSVSDDLYSIHQQLKGYDIYMKKISESFGTTSLDDLVKLHKTLSDKIYTLSVDINKTEDKIRELLISKEEDVKYIQIKTAKVNSLQSQFNFEYVEQRLESIRKSIDDCIDIFDTIGININNILTKDEFIHSINIITDIKDAINVVKSSSDEILLNDVLRDLRQGYSGIGDIEPNQRVLQSYIDMINQIDKDIERYSGMLEYVRELQKRPSNCNIDECAFIKKSLECSSLEPGKNIERLYIERGELVKKKEKQEKYINRLIESQKIYSMINNIIRVIEQNKNILNRLPTGRYITDLDYFLNNFTSVTMLNNLTNVQDTLQYANVLEQYKYYQTEIIKAESDYKIYKNNAEIIDEINEEITKLNSKLSNVISHIESRRDFLKQLQGEKVELDDKIKSLDNSIRILKEQEILKEKEEALLSRLATISNNMEIIKQEINKQNIINSNIATIDRDLIPACEEKDEIMYALKQLEEYNAELSVYNEKYSVIELIKKYSSPTKAGIQTLFMQLYMGKTISMANELLSLLFNGKFELLPYVINDSEFRIPCVNKESSVHHDDISSCSSGERSMISMMISFSLLYHSSTMYNILRLDEIDAALDQNNRSSFPLVLDRFMRELGVEHCIMISHSSEADMSNVDIILLKPVDNNIPSGNIIFTYND